MGDPARGPEDWSRAPGDRRSDRHDEFHRFRRRPATDARLHLHAEPMALPSRRSIRKTRNARETPARRAARKAQGTERTQAPYLLHPRSHQQRRNVMMDFNDATGKQRSLDLIPHGTIATVQIKVRPGTAGEGGWLKRSKDGNSEALDLELTVIGGPY